MPVKFLISSRADLPGLIEGLTEPFALISIYSHDREKGVKNLNTAYMRASQYLCFDDVSAKKKHFISEETIFELFWFFTESTKWVDTFVIQCEGGISRSSAVAVALARICQQSDAFVFENPVYHPNADVYQAILNAYRVAPFRVPGLYPLAKGLFWVKDPENCADTLIYEAMPCDADGNLLSALTTTEPLTHKALWATIRDRRVTEGRPFDYYPRGRIEIKKGFATIYLHPLLCREEVVGELVDRFGLYDKYGIRHFRTVADESAHYRVTQGEEHESKSS